MIYVCNARLIVSHILPEKIVQDDECFYFEVKRLQKMGIDKYLHMYKMSKGMVCLYFTKSVSSLIPITNIQLSDQ